MKKFFYASFFVILNILYLIVELSFNAYLLDSSSSMSLLTDFTQLELYGRSISAAGATLLFYRLLIPFKQGSTVTKTLIKFLLITIIIFPTVFMGQKKLIDHLVDSSTAEMRRSAEILSVLKYGLAQGFVEIDELSLGEIALETAEGKMFVVLSGMLIYSSPDELIKIDKQLGKIARYATTTQQLKVTQTSYRNYQYASQKIVSQYRQYAAYVEDYDKQLKNSRYKSIQLYQQAINNALSRWTSFRINKLNLEHLYQQKHEKLSVLIKQLNDKVKDCHIQKCAKQNSEKVISSINQLLGTQSTWQHWCNKQQDQQFISCQSNQDIVSYKLKIISEDYLVQQFGFERFYSNKIDYLTSREFYDLFLLSLEKNDVPLSKEYPLTQHALIIDEINNEIVRYLHDQYEQKVVQLMGENVRPKLSLGQFTLLQPMQNLYQKALGSIYSEALPITLSREQFLDQIVQPLFSKQQAFLSSKLLSDTSWFEQGAPYAESGKNNLRNLVIPPVAIAMSLIFGVLNMISLLLNIVFLIIKENTLKRWFGFVVLVSALMLTPRFNQYHIADQTAFEKLIIHTQQDYGAIIEVAEWIIKIEPLVYTVGNILRVNTLDGFEFD